MTLAPLGSIQDDSNLLSENYELFVLYHAVEGPCEVCWT